MNCGWIDLYFDGASIHKLKLLFFYHRSKNKQTNNACKEEETDCCDPDPNKQTNNACKEVTDCCDPDPNKQIMPVKKRRNRLLRPGPERKWTQPME